MAVQLGGTSAPRHHWTMKAASLVPAAAENEVQAQPKSYICAFSLCCFHISSANHNLKIMSPGMYSKLSEEYIHAGQVFQVTVCEELCKRQRNNQSVGPQPLAEDRWRQVPGSCFPTCAHSLYSNTDVASYRQKGCTECQWMRVNPHHPAPNTTAAHPRWQADSRCKRGGALEAEQRLS